MSLLEKFADIFFDVFGITKPTDKTRRLAAWFLFGMLLAVAVLLFLAAILLYHLIRA